MSCQSLSLALHDRLSLLFLQEAEEREVEELKSQQMSVDSQEIFTTQSNSILTVSANQTKLDSQVDSEDEFEPDISDEEVEKKLTIPFVFVPPPKPATPKETKQDKEVALSNDEELCDDEFTEGDLGESILANIESPTEEDNDAEEEQEWWNSQEQSASQRVKNDSMTISFLNSQREQEAMEAIAAIDDKQDSGLVVFSGFDGIGGGSVQLILFF